MALALQTHRHGHLVEAETLYNFILDAVPLHSPALHGLGLLQQQRGYHEHALSLIQTSVALEPDNASYWNALGKILQCRNFYEQATIAFQRSIALQPSFIEALCNLGNVLSQQGQTIKAVEYYCQAIVADPSRNRSRAMLAIGYSALGRIEEAAAVYRQWLEDEPENPTAAHLYAACSGEGIPERATDRYVETTFDEFAATFDEQLLGHLSYQIPTLIKDALAKALPTSRHLRGLDAGCGTGLCGAVIKPYVSHLTGVDLSSNMLVLARQRDMYNELNKAELTAYLASQVAKFDVIVMADTLIYFGVLTNVFAAVFDALHAEGIVIFTVENAHPRHSGPGYKLNLQGRYSHGHDYVCTALTACGFVVSAMIVSTLRLELGLPVEGTVFTAVKSAASL